MRKMINVIAAILMTAVLTTGCSTYSRGYVSGELVYQAYARIAEKKGPEFQTKVETLWKQIDAIEDKTEITDVWKSVAMEFDTVVSDPSLASWQRKVLTKTKESIEKEVSSVLNSYIVPNSSAMTYLIAVRQGIRDSIATESEK